MPGNNGAGDAGHPPVDQASLRPFHALPKPRAVDRPDLPTDLAEFYARYEGVGLDAIIQYPIRLGRLTEVVRVKYRELHTFDTEPFPGWENFSGFRLGCSQFLDEIVYVESAPCCPAGAILTLGPEVAGPGGEVPAHLMPNGRLWCGEPTHEEMGCTLVLAPNFSTWVRHIEQMGWTEYGLVPGGIKELPPDQRGGLYEYYRKLNPRAAWTKQ